MNHFTFLCIVLILKRFQCCTFDIAVCLDVSLPSHPQRNAAYHEFFRNYNIYVKSHFQGAQFEVEVFDYESRRIVNYEDEWWYYYNRFENIGEYVRGYYSQSGLYNCITNAINNRHRKYPTITKNVIIIATHAQLHNFFNIKEEFRNLRAKDFLVQLLGLKK